MGDTKRSMLEAIPEKCEFLLPTQSQESEMDGTCPNVNVDELKAPWGRLFSVVTWLDTVDLVESEITLGRGMDSDIVIVGSRFPTTQTNRYFSLSKTHFIISKETGLPVVITDLSRNGTFINGNLIGRNNKNILQNDDIISIGYKDQKVYLFKAMVTEDDEYLPADLKKIYEVFSLLGRGACGEVRLAFHKVTCKSYAIKKIVKAKYVSSGAFCMNDQKKINTEVEILKTLSHPFIMGLKEIVETEDAVFLVLDYMPGGELTNRILSMTRLTESQARFFFYQITLAVQHLHRNNITHRDLKAENVLLSSDGDDALVKVSDFGLSKIIHTNSIMETQCGTPTYVAPEILNGYYKEYNQQVDIWSLGVILFYMLSQELPFTAKDKKQLCTKIINGDYRMNNSCWYNVSEDAQDLVKRMLTVPPWKRVTIDGVLLHPWITKDKAMTSKVQSLVQQYYQERGIYTCGTLKDMNIPQPAKRLRA